MSKFTIVSFFFFFCNPTSLLVAQESPPSEEGVPMECETTQDGSLKCWAKMKSGETLRVQLAAPEIAPDRAAEPRSAVRVFLSAELGWVQLDGLDWASGIAGGGLRFFGRGEDTFGFEMDGGFGFTTSELGGLFAFTGRFLGLWNLLEWLAVGLGYEYDGASGVDTTPLQAHSARVEIRLGDPDGWQGFLYARLGRGVVAREVVVSPDVENTREIEHLWDDTGAIGLGARYNF